jgi:antitoxin (DNA-binding transcriptional repressor) of toxin-antitoxin stability system
MKTLKIEDATDLLANYAADPNQEPVILTVKGKPVAVVLPTQGADRETISLSFHPKFLAIMERSRIRHEREGGMSIEEARKYFGLPPYEGPKRATKARKSTSTRKARTNGRKRNGHGNGQQP